MRLALVPLLLAATVPIGVAAPPAGAMQAGPAACGRALPAEADADSFGGDAAPLVRETGTRFAAAATGLCGAGALRAADLAPFTRLLVRKAEGAAEPTVYDDAEQGPDTLILEFGFAGDTAPAQAAIGAAIRCWRQPERAGCDQGGE
jgi:hypothetical protein